MTHHALEALAEIALHPALRKYIGELVFVGARFSWPEAQGVHYTEPEKTSMSQDAWRTVEAIFANLQGAGLAPSVKCKWAYQEDKDSYYGLRALVLGFGDKATTPDTELSDSPRFGTRMLQAIEKSGLAIRSLTIGSDLWGASGKCFDLLGGKAGEVAVNLSQLHYLQLGISKLSATSQAGLYEDMGRAFASAVNLKECALIWTEFNENGDIGDGTRSQDDLTELATALSFAQLTDIRLKGCIISTASLLGFLGAFKRSLELLCIDEASLSEDECWSNVFIWLEKELRLGELKLHQLAGDELGELGGDYLAVNGIPVRVRHRGREAVQKALAEYVNSTDYSSTDEHDAFHDTNALNASGWMDDVE